MTCGTLGFDLLLSRKLTAVVSQGLGYRVQQWFVIETRPRGEFRAQENLGRQNFASFLPRFRKTRQKARKVDHILTPVFPGYMFVRFDPDRDPWRAINSTFGVRRLVAFGDSRPQAMPEEAMRALIARCDKQLIVRQLPDLAKGDQVRLVSGPFSEMIGRIEQFDAKGRVEILMDLLGRVMRVRVQPEVLGPVAG